MRDTTTKKRWDVVVVGAGPVGLSLALGLAREGRSALVLEKEPGTSDHSRAPIIWPRTQEILSDLGVIDQFLEAGIVQADIRLWDADREEVLLRVPIGELEGQTDHPRLLLCPQSEAERLLLGALQEEPSAEVRFSAEVTGLDLSPRDAEVRYEKGKAARSTSASFVAGCDGAGSRVREIIGASFEGQTYRMQAALADLTFEEGQDACYPRITRRRGVATALRIDQQRWRVIMPRAPDTTTPLDHRIDQAVADLFGPASYTAVWKSEFRLHRRVSDPFVQGRLALAGDAAHLTSPVGGQGMNIGIQDALALRRSLSEALARDRADPLVQYETERRKALEGGAVWATDILTQALLAWEGAFLAPALRLLGTALQARPVRRFVMRRMALLDDPSRTSSAPEAQEWEG
ncbi:FAD-dependent oxidoreductase [Salinibacter sp.]|uniref:FAD-dependent oxidoreductase n=1 Tax=Salinibacter sp. TaxID=2065818 RepID=UPI0021E6DC8E|nr:FAD-dependent monooxygenase [Salinibacter sp.]